MDMAERAADLGRHIVWFAASQTMVLLFAVTDDRAVELLRGPSGLSVAALVVAFNLAVYFPILRWSKRTIGSLLKVRGASQEERDAHAGLARWHSRLVWVFLILSVFILLGIAFDMPPRPPASEAG